jgi:hypothetical protein
MALLYPGYLVVRIILGCRQIIVSVSLLSARTAF